MQILELPKTLFTRLPMGRHAAFFYLGLLLSVIFTHHFVLDDDPNKCQTLARSGKYFDGRWVSDGCQSLPQGGREMNDCTRGKKRKIVLTGDTSLQEVFWVIASRLDRSVKIADPEPKDLHFSQGNIELEFVYDEWLNRTESIHRVEDLRDGKDVKPMLTVVGAGKAFVEKDDVDGYQSAVTSLADIAYSGKFPKVQPGSNRGFSNRDGPGDLLLFVPPSISRPERLEDGASLAAYWKLDERLDAFAMANPHISVLWSFQRMLDGRDFNHGIARLQADVILNMRCNAIAFHWPAGSGVCCGAWRRPNWIQSSFLLTGLVLLPGVIILDFVLPFFEPKRRTVVRGFGAFCAAIALQYITDRTHVFEQVMRFGWRGPDVLKMLAVAGLFGIFSMRRCKAVGKPSPDGKIPDQPFLPREQTDEWKGWMQLCIIIYHYNKGWEATWYWEIIRMSVSSYLFLTGFGHTLYHLQKKDYSFKRFVNVMIRTNLLPCTLAYVMDTRWLLYYYMPLATFWFAVTFATLAIGRKYNDKTWTLLIKIAASAFLVHIFISTRDLPETLFKLLAITCRISFDAKEFFGHRVAQDKFIVYIGMLSAMFYIWLRDVLSSTKRQDLLSRTVRSAFPLLKYLTIATSLAAFAYFWYYLQYHVPNQAAFTALQPYVSCVPILTFTILRNAHPLLRNWHSAIFAWLGRYSAEMYVMQNHIWLAGDQEAILRSGLFAGDESIWGDRWRDVLFLTPLYLIACSVIGDSTGVVANWFIQEKEAGAASSRRSAAASEVEIGLLSSENVEGGGGAEGELSGEKTSSRRLPLWQRLSVPWPTLKWRVFWVLIWMWALNWTYT